MKKHFASLTFYWYFHICSFSAIGTPVASFRQIQSTKHAIIKIEKELLTSTTESKDFHKQKIQDYNVHVNKIQKVQFLNLKTF